MHELLVLFIVADIIITVGVVWFVMKRRKQALQFLPETNPAIVSIEGIRALAGFAKEQHERIGNYMQANWSGIPNQLPDVLAGLLDKVEADARTQGITVDRDTLKAMLEASLRSHKIGKRDEVREALAKVA